jgi:hypothetical protein
MPDQLVFKEDQSSDKKALHEPYEDSDEGKGEASTGLKDFDGTEDAVMKLLKDLT